MVTAPNTAQLERIASDLGFHLDAGEIAMFGGMLAGPLAAYGALDALPDALPEPKWPRLPGRVPAREDNPYGAWQRVLDIRGAGEGRLAARKVAVKDCIAVAGVPLMNGSAAFEGYTPEIDATVVTRLLDEGAIIAGKSANEDYCYSGGSHTNARGPVDNPWRSGFTAGGSSSGSAALVGGGVLDLALGTDQGGSVRTPAACCGAVGMKPTFGLVPCTGVLGMEYSIDHIGPLTGTVADNALMLSVLAGPDGFDSRQGAAPLDDYSADLSKGVSGLRIGLLQEGFGSSRADPRVDAAVEAATRGLAEAGAEVVEISVPLHAMGGAIWLPLAAEGCLATMFHGHGSGFGPKGVYLPSAMQRQSLWRAQADLLADTVKLGMLLGEHMSRTYGGRYYGKAQNLRRLLTAAYDEALRKVDVFVMPTLPFPPPARPTAADSRETSIAAAYDLTPNTSPFNATGHPSLSLPCAFIDGLPIGMMITGGMYQERMIYRVAAAVERAMGPITRPGRPL
jgi:amidase